MKLKAALFLSALSSGAAQDCPSESGSVAIAGSSTVLPVAEKWANAFQAACSGVTFTVEGGGSSAGAGRVCADSSTGTTVQIGDMSRQWKDTEAEKQADGYTYNCLIGDTTRSAIQIDVAIDGLSVVVKSGGAAAGCLDKLPGLTIDQLRWIFSSYTDSELTATGWDAAAAIPNSDNDENTHLWSELNAACPSAEIKIAGADDQSGTYEYFSETIFADIDNGETFDAARPYENSADDNVIVTYLTNNDDAIGYFGYAYYSENEATFDVASIQSSAGTFVAPTSTTVGDGTYNPLARRIFMNLLNDETVLALTVPFIKYGLSGAGDALVSETGYVPIPNDAAMLARLPATDQPTNAPASDAPSPSICFSDRAQVQVEGMGAKRMDQLKIGDKVLTAKNRFSEVYSFGHFAPKEPTKILQIHAGQENPLEISVEHLLFVYNKTTKKTKPLPAENVKVGDFLLNKDGLPTPILSIETVERRGAYAPLTKTGDIVVSGILASNYVTLDSLKYVFEGQMLHFFQHGGTLPYRVYCATSGSCKSETYDESTGFSPWVFFWYRVEQWQLGLPGTFRTFLLSLMAIPALAIVFLGKVMTMSVSTLLVNIVGGVLGYVVWKKTLKTITADSIVHKTPEKYT